MTKNQPMAVPVWLSESLGIWQQYTLTGRPSCSLQSGNCGEKSGELGRKLLSFFLLVVD